MRYRFEEISPTAEHSKKLSCTVVIWIFREEIVGNTFWQIEHFIWSLARWCSNALFSVNFLLQLSHLYEKLPGPNCHLTIWYFSSWVFKSFLVLNSSMQILHSSLGFLKSMAFCFCCMIDGPLVSFSLSVKALLVVT